MFYEEVKPLILKKCLSSQELLRLDSPVKCRNFTVWAESCPTSHSCTVKQVSQGRGLTSQLSIPIVNYLLFSKDWVLCWLRQGPPGNKTPCFYKSCIVIAQWKPQQMLRRWDVKAASVGKYRVSEVKQCMHVQWMRTVLQRGNLTLVFTSFTVLICEW